MECSIDLFRFEVTWSVMAKQKNGVSERCRTWRKKRFKLIGQKIFVLFRSSPRNKFATTYRVVVKKDIGSKGYKFFTESYIHDVYVGYDEGAGHATIKASCFRSQRKNEEPHKLSLKCGSGR